MLRVFPRKAIYRRRGKVGGRPRGPHHMAARPGGRATTKCGLLVALLRLIFRLRVRVSKVGTSGFVSSNSENISRIFSKIQKQQKTGIGTMTSCQ